MEYGKYTLEFSINDYKLIQEFSGEVSIDDMRENLHYFLLACSWLPSQVKEILGEEY